MDRKTIPSLKCAARLNAAELAPITRQHHVLEAMLLFIVVVLIYVSSPVIDTGDSHFVIPTAMSMIRHGDANVDEYHDRFMEAPWALRVENGHTWNVYPVGVPLLALPFVWVCDRAASLCGVDLESVIIHKYPAFLDLCLGGIFTAGAVALLFLYCRSQLSPARSVLLTALFAFGTPAYSSASRGLWQHGPAMLLFFVALLLYARLKDRGLRGFTIAFALGVVVGYSYSVRPSNSLVIIGFGLLLAMEARRLLTPYVLGAVVGLLPLFIYNLIAFGTWSSHYYRMLQDVVLHTGLRFPGILGVLISPSRGLLIFSPFVVFIVLRFNRTYRQRYPWTRLEVLLGIWSIAWWLGTSKWPFWTGGGSYGPRLLSEVFPCVAILLIPIVQELSIERGSARRISTVAFVVMGAISIAMNLRGATAWPPNYDWNQGPPDINTAPGKVWAWSDPQFLAGLGELYREANPVGAAAQATGLDRPLSYFGQSITSTVARLSLHPGEEIKVPVLIRNPGPETWVSQGRYPVNLSYKWFRDGQMLPIEGLRTTLAEAVAPNQSENVNARIMAPLRGRYTLRITLVQEAVAWFMMKSNSFLEIPATVN